MLSNPTLLMWSLLFGAFGTGYAVYGWRQRRPIPLIVGVALTLYTFFITNVYLVVLLGIALIATPYFVRID